MKGIEQIAQAILDDAHKKAAVIEQDAAERSDTVLREAKEQVEVLMSNAQQRAANYVDDAVQKGMLSAQLSTRMKVAAEKQTEVNRTFALAKQHLISMPEEQRFELLSKLLQEALSDGLGGELLLNDYDRKELGSRLVKHANKTSGERVTLSDDTADIAGGLIVRRGPVEINCALDEIIRTMADKKSFAVMQILFA